MKPYFQKVSYELTALEFSRTVIIKCTLRDTICIKFNRKIN